MKGKTSKKEKDRTRDRWNNKANSKSKKAIGTQTMSKDKRSTSKRKMCKLMSNSHPLIWIKRMSLKK
jgi:hypothetical protein